MALKTKEDVIKVIRKSKKEDVDLWLTGSFDKLIDEELLRWMIDYIFGLSGDYGLDIKVHGKEPQRREKNQELYAIFSKYAKENYSLRIMHWPGRRDVSLEFRPYENPDGSVLPLVEIRIMGQLDYSDQFMGCMVGSAIGDAVGEIHQHHEELKLEEIQKKYPVLEYTDDTVQALVVARFLISGDYTTKNLGDLFLKALNAKPDRGYGGTATIFSIAEVNGISYIEARNRFNRAFNNSEGSWSDGAAMRIHPAGLFFRRIKNLREKTDFISDIDHSHPIAKEGAYLCAYLIQLMLKRPRESAMDWLEPLMSACKTPEMQSSMAFVHEALLYDYTPTAVDEHLGNENRSTTATQSVVPFALFSFFRNSDSFDDCLNTAISTKGDADTIGAIACAFSGAYLGKKIVSRNMFYSTLENRERIEKLAVRLLDESRTVNLP